MPKVELRDGGVVWVSPPDVPGMRVDPDGYFFQNPPTQIVKGKKSNPKEGEDERILEVNEPKAFEEILRDAMLYYHNTPKAWGAATTTVFGAATFGQIYHESATSWSVARAGGDTFTVDTTTTDFFVGSRRFFNANWRVDQPHYRFDTSSIPDGDSITTAVPSIYVGTDSSGVDFDIYLDQISGGFGAAVTSADYVAGNSLPSSGSLLVDLPTINTSAWTGSAGYYDLTTSSTSWFSFINKSGNSDFYLFDSRTDGNQAPVNGDFYYWSFSSPSNTGTTFDPKLVVTHIPVVKSHKIIRSKARHRASRW